MRTARSGFAACAALVVGLVSAACGGGDGSTGAATPASGPVGATPASVTDVTTATVTTAPAPTSLSAAGSGPVATSAPGATAVTGPSTGPPASADPVGGVAPTAGPATEAAPAPAAAPAAEADAAPDDTAAPDEPASTAPAAPDPAPPTAGPGAPPPTPTAPAAPTAPPSTAPAAHTPGVGPSQLAQMVCEEDEVRDAVAYYAGEALLAPPQPTYAGGLYTCPYRLPDGTVTLSVQELADAAATDRYYAGLAAQLGNAGRVFLGEDGFQTSAGSVVVRKDFLVLLVDTSAFADLPSPRSRSQLANNLAIVIMACWT